MPCWSRWSGYRLKRDRNSMKSIEIPVVLALVHLFGVRTTGLNKMK